MGPRTATALNIFFAINRCSSLSKYNLGFGGAGPSGLQMEGLGQSGFVE